MTQAFINEKKLEFVKSDGKDGLQDFWGGVDRQGEHFYELHFVSGPDGPTPGQIERYTAFCDNLSAIVNSIKERVSNHLSTQDETIRKKWQNRPLDLSIVGVHPDGSEADIEINCYLRRRVLFFVCGKGFYVKLRNNRIVEFVAE